MMLSNHVTTVKPLMVRSRVQYLRKSQQSVVENCLKNSIKKTEIAAANKTNDKLIEGLSLFPALN